MSSPRHPHPASPFSPRYTRTRRHLFAVPTRTSRHLFGEGAIHQFTRRRGLLHRIAEPAASDRQRQRVLSTKHIESKWRDGARCLSEIFRAGRNDVDGSRRRGVIDVNFGIDEESRTGKRRTREQAELFRGMIREMIRAGIVRGITPRIVGNDHVFGFAKRRLFAARRAPRRWTIVRDHPASDTPREGTAPPGWSQPLPSRDAVPHPPPSAGGGPPSRPTGRPKNPRRHSHLTSAVPSLTMHGSWPECCWRLTVSCIRHEHRSE